jgi:hypothetical protein
VAPPLDLNGTDGGGGIPSPKSKLQPLNYVADLFAAFAMNEPAAACNTDRSGNGRDFSPGKGPIASEMANVMDLVPGKAACIPGSTVLYPSAPAYCSQADQAWQLEGEWTCAFRFWNSKPATGSGGGSGASWNSVPLCIYPTLPASIQLIIYVNALNQLCTYSENMKAPNGFESTLYVPPNQWTFLTHRRDAAGTVTLGVGTGPKAAQQSYQSGGLAQRPQNTPGQAGFTAYFGKYPLDGNGGGGAFADFVFWTRRLTDAELLPQVRAAMAGAP